jgi:cytochrome c oxidase subunit 3
MRSLAPEIQYEDLEHQGQTAQLGMWAFIATEIVFFGALMLAYYVYRSAYPQEFQVAGADSKLLLGSINSVLLLTSSLTMVLAINFAAEGRQKLLVRFLLLTALLGFLFIGVKGLEYYQDYTDRVVPGVNFAFRPGYGRPAELYWVIYFVGTGVHAVHMSVGIVLLLVMARRAARGAFSPAYTAPLEVLGLYWSFVDAVWVFLFAAIYLLGRSPS